MSLLAGMTCVAILSYGTLLLGIALLVNLGEMTGPYAVAHLAGGAAWAGAVWKLGPAVDPNPER